MQTRSVVAVCFQVVKVSFQASRFQVVEGLFTQLEAGYFQVVAGRSKEIEAGRSQVAGLTHCVRGQVGAGRSPAIVAAASNCSRAVI